MKSPSEDNACQSTQLLDVGEVAGRLHECSTRTIYRYAQKGVLPHPLKLAGEVIGWNLTLPNSSPNRKRNAAAKVMRPHLIKPSYTKNGKRHEGRLYHAVIRLDNWPRARRFPLGMSDRKCAEMRLHELIQELEREAFGYGIPRGMRQAAEKPFVEHAEDYVAALSSDGCSSMHVYNVEHRLKNSPMNAGGSNCGMSMRIRF